MDQEKMLLKTSEFYIKESERIMKKARAAKTREEKMEALKELLSIKSKISFEIKEIDNFIDRGY